MNEENNWYSPDDWYRPASDFSASEGRKVKSTQPAPEKKNRSNAWRTAGIAILALLVLISGTSIMFRNTSATVSINGSSFSFGNKPGSDSSTEGSGHDDGFNYSVDGNADDADDKTDEMPESPSDFFDSFYTDTDTDTADVNIQTDSYSGKSTVGITSASGEELTLQQLYAECCPSIVAITGYVNGTDGYYWGTGVVLSSDGLILTNTHVVEGCDSAVVTLNDDSEYNATLIGADSISDIAVLKIDAKGLKPARFGDSSALTVGDRVAAIGNPLGEEFRFTLTDGIISAIDRGINSNGHTMTLLQTNTAINSGNSGGPLFNMNGQVIGVTNMKMMSAYSSIEGIGFAIPSITVVNVVNSLIADGEVRGRPSIGITVGAIPDSAKEHYKMPAGLYITDVSKGSDAETKGILPGDVLTAVNGIEVTTTAEVGEIKNKYNVGDTLKLTIWRSGEIIEFEVKLIDTLDIYG